MSLGPENSKCNSMQPNSVPATPAAEGQTCWLRCGGTAVACESVLSVAAQLPAAIRITSLRKCCEETQCLPHHPTAQTHVAFISLVESLAQPTPDTMQCMCRLCILLHCIKTLAQTDNSNV